jgi:hypothetical protein
MKESAVSKDELEKLQDSAASTALQIRRRIETAIDCGDVPTWVLDACSELERSSLIYGAASAQLDSIVVMPRDFSGILLH